MKKIKQIKIYDGTSWIECLLTADGNIFNIEDGEIAGSLQQRTHEDDTKNPQATGLGAVAFGGFRGDKPNGTPDDEDRISKAEGIQSATFGAGTQAHGNWDIAAGKDSDTYQQASFVFGGGCQAGLSEEEFNAKNSKTLYYNDVEYIIPNHVSYNGQFVVIHSTLNDSAITEVDGKLVINTNEVYYGVGGGMNGDEYVKITLEELATYPIKDASLREYDSSYSFAVAFGDDNKSTGRASFTANKGNTTSGENSATFGYGNSNTGANTLIGGSNNTSEGGYNAAIFGSYQLVEKFKNCLLAGSKHVASRDFQAIFGRWAKENPDAILIVSDRSGPQDGTLTDNNFMVMADGRAKVFKAPEEDNDVVRLKELEEAVSSIIGPDADEALDTLKEIQQLLEGDETGVAGLISAVNNKYDVVDGVFLEKDSVVVSDGSDYAVYIFPDGIEFITPSGPAYHYPSLKGGMLLTDAELVSWADEGQVLTRNPEGLAFVYVDELIDITSHINDTLSYDEVYRGNFIDSVNVNSGSAIANLMPEHLLITVGETDQAFLNPNYLYLSKYDEDEGSTHETYYYRDRISGEGEFGAFELTFPYVSGTIATQEFVSENMFSLPSGVHIGDDTLVGSPYDVIELVSDQGDDLVTQIRPDRIYTNGQFTVSDNNGIWTGFTPTNINITDSITNADVTYKLTFPMENGTFLTDASGYKKVDNISINSNDESIGIPSILVGSYSEDSVGWSRICAADIKLVSPAGGYIALHKDTTGEVLSLDPTKIGRADADGNEGEYAFPSQFGTILTDNELLQTAQPDAGEQILTVVDGKLQFDYASNVIDFGLYIADTVEGGGISTAWFTQSVDVGSMTDGYANLTKSGLYVQSDGAHNVYLSPEILNMYNGDGGPDALGEGLQIQVSGIKQICWVMDEEDSTVTVERALSFNFPTESGTLATQEYVQTNAGGGKLYYCEISADEDEIVINIVSSRQISNIDDFLSYVGGVCERFQAGMPANGSYQGKPIFSVSYIGDLNIGHSTGSIIDFSIVENLNQTWTVNCVPIE